MMKKRMLGVIAVLLVCIFALSACKKEAGKPVDNAVSENTTDDSEETDQTEDAGNVKEDKRNDLCYYSAILEYDIQKIYILMMIKQENMMKKLKR